MRNVCMVTSGKHTWGMYAWLLVGNTYVRNVCMWLVGIHTWGIHKWWEIRTCWWRHDAQISIRLCWLGISRITGQEVQSTYIITSEEYACIIILVTRLVLWNCEVLLAGWMAGWNTCIWLLWKCKTFTCWAPWCGMWCVGYGRHRLSLAKKFIFWSHSPEVSVTSVHIFIVNMFV